jgi:DNA polymerase-3 subunit alpha
MLELKRFEPHAHTHYSNIRLLDSINKPKDLINRAIELGLAGIAITDHECLSSHMEVNLYAQKILKENPNFKIALGNEIYLTETRENNQKYFHFILIAKNKMGHKALRELSSVSWMNSYFDRGMERVPTLYSELEAIVKKYPNSLIATSACLGGELSSNTLQLCHCDTIGNKDGSIEAHNNIVNFVLWCKELFGDDFYIECAPGCSRDQILVNKRLVFIANAFNLKMIIGTDAHYLKKEDRYVHKAYLNSKGGEREVDEFYEYSYLQSNEEIVKNLLESYSDTPEIIEQMFNNSMEIWNKIENYSLAHKQTIPKVEVKDYPKQYGDDELAECHPALYHMLQSDDKIERYWVNECLQKLKENDKYNKEYLDRLEEEADIKYTIGTKLETNMFAYPVTLQHYVDLFWKCGSMVGAGRGSSCSGLNHYLLGITQLDPIQWELPFWRYLNKERTELGDIDLDLCPSKRPKILKE